MEDTGFYVITCQELDEETNKMETVVSHGIGDVTLRGVVLSGETLSEFMRLHAKHLRRRNGELFYIYDHEESND